jgi:hypothetical protein
MYQALIKGPQVPLTDFIWKAPIPLKIKIFTWQLAKERLPSNDQIHLRVGPSNVNCALFGDLENTDHIFSQSILAKFPGSGIRAMFGVNWNPSSHLDWFSILNTLGTKAKRFIWVFFAAQCWAIWTMRSRFIIK